MHCWTALAFAALISCTHSALPAGGSAERAIREADAAWVRAAATHKAQAWTAFYSDDATVLPPGESTCDTKQKIHASIAAFLALPDLKVTWKPMRVVVASSGDLGYSFGTYEVTYTDHGKTVSDHGKNVEIWKKQRNGQWKCVVDTWNSDLPTP